MKRKYAILLSPDANTGGDSSNSPADSAIESQKDVQKTTDSSTVGSDGKKSDDKQPTLQDVVKGVLDKHKQSDSSTDKSEEEDADSAVLNKNATDAEKDKKGGEKKEEPSAAKEDDAKLPFNKHPRFVELIGQKNAAETKVKEFEPIVQRMQNVEKYCEANNIDESAFSEALEVTAMVRKNPREALKKLEGIVNALRLQTGEALPPDLQKRLDEGLIDADTAKETAALRIEQARIQQQQKQVSANTQQNTQRELTQSLDAWTQTKFGTDPDFKPKGSATAPDGKYELVYNKFMHFWHTKPIYSTKEAVALLEQAYIDVDSSIKSFLPQPTKRRPLSSTSSSTKQTVEKIDTSKPGWARKVAAGFKG